MIERRQVHQPDPKEFELPETTYSHDIEHQVFRDIISHILAEIPGISPVEGTFLGNFIGRTDAVRGISIEQDPKSRSVLVTIEVRVQYGLNIPHLAEEIQTRVTKEILAMTGMHVGAIHIVFKELMLSCPIGQTIKSPPSTFSEVSDDEFS